ncbi:DUF445 domain-containing protein [Kibdelosporangium persicum]|uniref:DUF445 domain-containing protein n=1 Tax=Kibdelosporangium persicum TaxID=2698649 RepID=A0ABX2F4J6_9PSEU|nr:DUF445 domain-containing protein [Kibdelosporangium persicum]NRN66157.1 DUF445 domain-containing protein [Kibdelosporangium persicum]
MADWVVYVAMPFVAAALGYVTKRIAIEMMFRPLRFAGIPGTFLGWQGVVPRNAERMIRIAAEVLTTRLVDAREVFARVDPDRLAEALEPALLAEVDAITRSVLARHHPGLWEALPVLAQDVIVKQVQAGSPNAVRRIVEALQDDIDQVLDIKELAVGTLRRDPALMVRLIKDISRPEMAFIARSGIYFGFALGLVQTLVWALTKEPLVLPLFGMAIGWFTDWLAIKLVFFPRERRFGFQAVFQKRRDEVAEQYGHLVATRVMTVPNILESVLNGPRADRLEALVERVVWETVDRQAELARPLVASAIGERRLREMKREAARQAIERLPATIRHAEDYLTRTLDVGNTIATKMRDLTRVEYEELLRPAFRRDEWKLIAVGAVVGFVVGELQVLLLV